jgi:hypothetical protein
MALDISSEAQGAQGRDEQDFSFIWGCFIHTALACNWYLGRRWRDGTVADNKHGVAAQVRTLAFALHFIVLSSITALLFYFLNYRSTPPYLRCVFPLNYFDILSISGLLLRRRIGCSGLPEALLKKFAELRSLEEGNIVAISNSTYSV